MTFQDVEAAREIYHQKSKKAWIKAVAVALIIGLAFSLTNFMQVSSIKNGSTPIIIFFIFGSIFATGILVLVFGFIGINLTAKKEAIDYRKAYKAYFVEQNLKNTFTDLRYSHEGSLDKSILASTGMVNTGDRYSSNDLTIAKYKNVQFIHADAHIQVEQSDSDGGTTYVTIFKGRFMIFEFPKKFNFKLELAGRKFHAYRVPGKNQTTGRSMQKISTESTDFNKLFKIYAEDGFEAYYILDPAFMAKIENIAIRYKDKVLLGFVDNRLLIGLNDDKDSFEPPKASKPINEQAEMQKIRSDIKVITDFVDELSLDRKIFKS